MGEGVYPRENGAGFDPVVETPKSQRRIFPPMTSGTVRGFAFKPR